MNHAAPDRRVWTKSSFSSPSGNCLEATRNPDGTVSIRNSNAIDQGEVVYTADEIRAAIAGFKAGEFDFLVD